MPGGDVPADRGLGELLDLRRGQPAPKQRVHEFPDLRGVHRLRLYQRGSDRRYRRTSASLATRSPASSRAARVVASARARRRPSPARAITSP